MKDFKEIAEKCLKRELSGYFILKNGKKKFSDDLKKNTSAEHLEEMYYFTPLKYYDKYGNCTVSIGDANFTENCIEKFIPDFQYIENLEISLASIDPNDKTFMDDKGNWFNLLKKENDFYIFEDTYGTIIHKTPYQAMKLKTMAEWIMTPKEQKEVKIEIPEGYDIDKEKSTFEKIVFKKKDSKPRSWEEYCKQNESNGQYGCYVSNDSGFKEVTWSACSSANLWKNTLPSKELAEKFLAYMQLMSLRQAWIGDWEPDWKDFDTRKWGILLQDDELVIDSFYHCAKPLSFPTKKKKKEFMNTFGNLLEQAKGLY